MRRGVRTVEDALRLLDGLFPTENDRWTSDGADWWNRFYTDRSRPIPFFVPKPDENLASYLDRGLIEPGRALDLGCGPGRNALYLASRGFRVDAVDLAPNAIEWARDRARESGAEVAFHCGDAFAGAVPDGPYDLIVDSGCLHHLAPHRRISYLALIDRVLAPGGHLALTCFAPVGGQSGTELPDEALYRDRSLHGGLAYGEDDLRYLFSDLTEREIRPMHEQPEDAPTFGAPFLLTALFRRP